MKVHVVTLGHMHTISGSSIFSAAGGCVREVHSSASTKNSVACYSKCLKNVILNL